MIKSPQFYKLIGKLPVLCRDLQEWVQWAAHNHIVRVAETQVGPLWVSTVFLGIDHGMLEGEEPLLFETMIFDDFHNDYQSRCSTWAQAEFMHKVAVAIAQDQYTAALKSLEKKEAQ